MLPGFCVKALTKLAINVNFDEIRATVWMCPSKTCLDKRVNFLKHSPYLKKILMAINYIRWVIISRFLKCVNIFVCYAKKQKQIVQFLRNFQKVHKIFALRFFFLLPWFCVVMQQKTQFTQQAGQFPSKPRMCLEKNSFLKKFTLMFSNFWYSRAP